MNKKSIATVFIILGVIGAGIFVYSDLTKENNRDTSGAGVQDNILLPDLERMVIADDITGEKRQEIEERITNIYEVIEEDPTLQATWIGLGNWRKEAKDYEGAAEVWSFVMAEWPEQRIGYENMGVLQHFYIRDYAEAEKYFKLAIDMEPNFANSYINLHELYKYSYSEKEKLADDVLLEGLKVLPGHVALLYTLAEYYEDSGDTVNARTYYEQVLVTARSAGDVETVERVEGILESL